MVSKKIDILNRDKNNQDHIRTNTTTMVKNTSTKTKAKPGPKPKTKPKVKSVNSGSKTSKKKPVITKPIDVPIKRRGRRPKKILDNVADDDTENNENNDSTDTVPNNENDEPQTGNNSAVILRLKIDPAKLKKLSDAKKKLNTAENITSIMKPSKSSVKSTTKSASKPVTKPTVKPKTMPLEIPIEESTDESSEGMFRNDIPDDHICHKCMKNERAVSILKTKLEKYENKEKIDHSTKIYSNALKFISTDSNSKITIKKTNTKCWWCAHSFSNLPCFLPELYHNQTYHVTGCFCSFNCALAYNLYYLKDSKMHQRKALIFKLYRELHGLNPGDSIDIREAPPKEILEDFGGNMSIEIFRRSFITVNKEYLVFVPPIKPITVTIEERNIESTEVNNSKKYVLKRSKPLSKKRTIMSSMKMSLDNDDSSGSAEVAVD